jgi:NtrC-family two-component system response regulator AlgB
MKPNFQMSTTPNMASHGQRSDPYPFGTALPSMRTMVLSPEPRISTQLSSSLRSFGCQVTRATALSPAMKILRSAPHDLILLDIQQDTADSAAWVPHLLSEDYSLRIVALTPPDAINTIVRCMRAGAKECLAKPIEVERLREVVLQSPIPLPEPDEDDPFASSSPRMRLAIESARRAALVDIPVLLRGEHGTGKTMLARVLHRSSKRASRPFVTINCPELSEELATSELFGHRRDSFTGAVADQLGKVEVAEGGSLFLDELGDLPLGVQSRILRFLQDQRFERLGETITRSADVRLISATNRDLESLISCGDFRADLFYRINGIEITIPPLRQRREDILPLADRLLRGFSKTHGRSIRFSSATCDLLVSYDWPGNVRELSNEIHRAVVMCTKPYIDPPDLSPRLQTASMGSSIHLGGNCTLRQIGDEHIAQLLTRHPRACHAARVLDIERSTLLSRRRLAEKRLQMERGGTPA